MTKTKKPTNGMKSKAPNAKAVIRRIVEPGVHVLKREMAGHITRCHQDNTPLPEAFHEFTSKCRYCDRTVTKGRSDAEILALIAPLELCTFCQHESDGLVDLFTDSTI